MIQVLRSAIIMLKRKYGLSEILNSRFPKTEEILDSAISLPIYPTLRDEEVEYVANALSKVIH